MSTICLRGFLINADGDAGVDATNAKSAVALLTGMLANGAAVVGHPGSPLHTGRPSNATRPVATVAGTVVTVLDTQ
jgi:hypothetical protein